MSLTVGTRIIADVRVQEVVIARQIGSYDLQFHVQADIRPLDPGEVISAVLYSADVAVKVDGRAAIIGGSARPKVPLHLEPSQAPRTEQLVFSLQLTPHQLTAVEELREASDIEFELTFHGQGQAAGYRQSVQRDWRFNVPRSKWLQRLNEAGYSETLLLEIPMPTGGLSESWKEASNALKRAQANFNNADYFACVADCRLVVEEVGIRESGDRNWLESASQLLKGTLKDMSHKNRLLILLSAIRNYTHMAHHAVGDGGHSEFTRADAKFILALTADVMIRAHRK